MSDISCEYDSALSSNSDSEEASPSLPMAHISKVSPVERREVLFRGRERLNQNELNNRLHEAVRHGRVEQVVYYIRHGANPQMVVNNGQLLLHIAFERGDIECAMVLLEPERFMNPSPLELNEHLPME